MKRTHLSLLILAITVTLGAAVCKRLIWHVPVPPIATKKLDHKPTDKTLLAWSAWDKARIAKALREYDIACGPVATEDASINLILTEMELPIWTDAAIVPTEDKSPVDGSDEGVEAPSTTTMYASNGYPLPWPPTPFLYGVPPTWLPPPRRIGPPRKHPGQPVSPPPVVAPVPEPPSFWLILSGILGLVLIRKAKEVRA